MTVAITLRCQRCGRETDTDHSRNGICLECLVREAISADLADYKRLWAKRRRYLRMGTPHNDEQISRIAKRINLKVHAVVTGPKAISFFNELLHEARQKAETVDGRILVAQPGDMNALLTSTKH